MKTFLKPSLCIMLVISVIFLSSCKKEKQKKSIKGLAYNAVKNESLCVSDWFPHSQTPAPEEGKGSPFDVSESTNAIFHQWSWQKFLWLTKPTYGNEKMPFFLDPMNLTQISSHMEDIPQREGASVVLMDINQAGSSGVLTTNPDYSIHKKSDTVFYSIHMDPIMKNAAVKFKDSIINGTLNKNNLSSFPVGSLELKVSWVKTKSIKANDLKKYFTTVASISKDGGKTYKNSEVALLGMHVVGVVENHPEFIWATFEHEGLAPNYNWKKNEAVSVTDKLLFAKGKTSGINGIKVDATTKEPNLKYKVFDLFKYGVPRDNTGAFMKTAQSEPENFNNIKRINACVKENLKDVWKNYFYNGSIWMDTDGYTKEQQAQILVGLRDAIANGGALSFARGSLNCANVSMETFTQTFNSDINQINVGSLANCFSCHNAAGYPSVGGSPLYMSHVFDSYVKIAEGKTATEVEALKAKQEVLEFMRAKLK